MTSITPSSSVLDANVLIAHFDPDDALHVRAVAALGDAAATMRIHPFTLAECLVAPVRLGREEQFLRGVERLGITAIVLDPGAPLRLAGLRATTGLRLPDCCVLDAAIHHGAELLSFDQRLRSAATDRGVAVGPR